MNRNHTIIQSLLVYCTSLAVMAFTSPYAISDEADQRIARVEGGLLPKMVKQGRAGQGVELLERMRANSIPGLSIAVIDGGGIAWSRSFGVIESGQQTPVVPTTLFQAGSISKPVAAMGALQLVERKELDLDADVNDFLTSWQVPKSELTKDERVTLRGLLSHSAGLTVHGFPGYAANAKVPTLKQVLNGAPPANTAAIVVDYLPGSRFRYSGGGYTVMQQAAIDVTGQPFPEFMRETVLAPLKMTNSSYRQPLPKASRAHAATGHHAGTAEIVAGKYHTYPEMAAAGLWTTPSDLARFAIAVHHSAQGGSGSVLTPDMCQQMLSRQKNGWGLGFAIDGKGESKRFSHGGVDEGFDAHLVAYVDTGQGAVVMANANGSQRLIQEVLGSIAREYDWPDYPLGKQREYIPVKRELLETYVGRYEISPQFALTVQIKDGQLHIQGTGQRALRIFPISPAEWAAADINAQITFKVNDGECQSLILHQGGRNTPARRVAE